MASINSTLSLINGTSHNCNLTDSTAAKICKIVVLSIVLLTGLVGNVLIIIVVYKNKELRRPINYFIVNMAISDLVLPSAIIPTLLAWIVGDSNCKQRWFTDGTLELVVCKAVSFLTICSLLVSVQSLTWIAIDRFVAVVFPMKFRFISSKFCAKAIISTWIVAVVVVGPSMLPQRLVKYKPTAQCRNSFSFSTANETTGITYDRLYVSAFLILPLFVVTILYSAIARALNRKGSIFANTCPNIQRQTKKKKRAVKMSVCIVTALYVCYLPGLFSNLLSMYGAKIIRSCWYIEEFVLTVGVLFVVSSTVNPIICFTFAGRYRRGLKDVLASCCTKSSNVKREIVKPEQVTLKHIKHTGEKENRPSTDETVRVSHLNTAL